MCSLYNLKLIFIIINLNKVQLLKEENDHWQNVGLKDIENALNLKTNENTAKNVILFIGDGMGLTTITASRIYSKSEGGFLSFEKFPHIGTLKTYNADKLVPDSCSTATALFSGIKANTKTAGVPPTVHVDSCAESLLETNQIKGMFTWAQNAKKSTGFVTTTRVTHATPSALYAHTPNRKWECEATKPVTAKECKDIARQLVEDMPGRDINVIMGGGRQMMVSGISGNESDPVDTWACYRQDGRDLISDWKNYQKKTNRKFAVVQNNGELDNVNKDVEYLLGIFANGHMKMDHARDKSPKGMPSLANMTSKSLEILSKNPNGYILVVEGGMIDFGHHRGHARQALDETAAFSDAVQVALDKTNPKETLIIVTSDHAHSLAFSGYPSRDSSVLDIAQNSKIDNIPYTSLLYTTGGINNFQYKINQDGNVERINPSGENTRDFQYSQQAAVMTDEVTHSGSDVLVYAYGPMAHLFHTVHEQTYVAYVVSYAAKIGPLKNLKNSAKNQQFNTILCIFLLILVKIVKN